MTKILTPLPWWTGIQTLKKDLATSVARKGGQWSDHSSDNTRPHKSAISALSLLVRDTPGGFDPSFVLFKPTFPPFGPGGMQPPQGLIERRMHPHEWKLVSFPFCCMALVQTKSLSTQLSLTTNQRNPGCLVIAGNTGNVVCNTSFTDLSDSRVKTEIRGRRG